MYSKFIFGILRYLYTLIGILGYFDPNAGFVFFSVKAGQVIDILWKSLIEMLLGNQHYY